MKTLKGEGPEDFFGCFVLNWQGLYWFWEKLLMNWKRQKKSCEKKITSGEGLKKLRQMVELQGGSTALIDYPDQFKPSPFQSHWIASESGYLSQMNAKSDWRNFNEISELAGTTKESEIDLNCGIILHKKTRRQNRKGRYNC